MAKTRTPLSPIGPIEFNRAQSGAEDAKDTRETTTVEVAPISRSIDDDLSRVDRRRYSDSEREIIES